MPEAEQKVEVRTVYVPSAPEIKTVYVPSEPEIKTVYVESPAKEGVSEKLLIGLALLVLLLIVYSLRQKRKLSKISKVLKKEHEELEHMLEHQEDLMVNVGEKIRRPASYNFV